MTISSTSNIKCCSCCGCNFLPQRPLQKVCGPVCAIKLAKVKQKSDSKNFKERKESIKTIYDLIKDAQKEFNAYVRERDSLKPCICCGRTESMGYGTSAHGWDCGHYRSTGSASHLRFNEDNAHRQLVICNRHGAGRAVDYRIGLIARIGLERVEALESNNEVVKWSREELLSIKLKYRQKLKDLKK
jgi:Bacteriophage Lambda NinG protein